MSSDLSTDPAPLEIERVVDPQRVQPTPHFSAVRLDSAAMRGDVDPFMSVDHFRMAAPTFPPHPHAGFSAVTYVLPESSAGMDNRDSRGDRSNISPGGVHWTAAGSGIVHEEVPDRPGQAVEGFQIFVKQPADQEELAPVIHHVEASAVPEVVLARGGRARTIAGSVEGGGAPFTPPSPLAAIDVDLSPGDSFDWALPWDDTACAVYLFRGEAIVAGVALTAPKLVIFRRGGGTLALSTDQGARLFVMAGKPLRQPIYSNGPFAMGSEAGVRRALERYRAGQMGDIALQ